MDKKNWYKNAVIYQIYPRSFQDSNGDGIGDIRGIISRLDYLQELGIDAIWLSPIYKSPQDDNGYDISDYQDIDPIFGNLEDMKELITEGRKRGIGMIMDLVLNHCSDEHPWFVEAKKSKDNPYHDYFVWRDGVEGVLPNELRAGFGGSAWQWVPELGQYYFHQFSVKQPDLNWDNPKVRQEIYDMINWWIDLGVAGFRLDVIDQIAKEPDQLITQNGPRLHEFIREMNASSFGSRLAVDGRGLITVGECWGANLENTPVYSSPKGDEFSMVFQFDHINLDQVEGKNKWYLADLELVKLKKVFQKWQTALYQKGWYSLFWSNHDLPRIVSRWGNDSDQYRVLSAKMLAILLHGMQGTPYVYEGEELGMTNTPMALDEYRDIEAVNMTKEYLEMGWSEERVLESLYAKSRDNARTPMHWDDSANAGFTSGQPWLKINPNYTTINAASQVKDPDSVFSCYKRVIANRKKYPVFAEGNFTLYEAEDPDLFLYSRETEAEQLLVIANFHEKERSYQLPQGFEKAFDQEEGWEKLVSNYPDSSCGRLRPYEALMLYHK